MPTNDFSDAFEQLAETDFWVDLAMVIAGFLVAGASQSLLEGSVPWDLPNEAYGFAVAGVVLWMDAPYKMELATGGAMNAVDAGAQRLGIQESVQATL
jgi:hypothetical protein